MKLSLPIYRLKRQARLLSREAKIPLAEALDRIARREGQPSWSMLAHLSARQNVGARLLSEFAPGDFLLLAARPGHGKTLLGLELAAAAARAGRDAVFFSLEETQAGLLKRLADLRVDPPAQRFAIDTSDDISAGHVMSRLKASRRGALAVIDYLQLLDQRRSNPDLCVQVRDLGEFARAAGVTIVAISQVDRAFEAHGGSLPGLADIRLPNPVDLGLFSHACFLHDGQMRLQTIGAVS